MSLANENHRIHGIKAHRMIDVTMTWTNSLVFDVRANDLTKIQDIEVRPAYSDFFKRRSIKGEESLINSGISGHLKCPAFKDFLYNCYVLSFPFDLHFRLEPETQSFYIVNSGIEIGPDMILVRWPKKKPVTRVVISISPFILFDTSEDVLMEVSPAFLHAIDPRVRRLTPIPGAFNIGRWLRPIDFTFEVDLLDGDIELLKGDPLLYLRFMTSNNEAVRINKRPFDGDFSRRALECMAIAQNNSSAANNTPSLNHYYQALSQGKGK
jgi:hypothetical protein